MNINEVKSYHFSLDSNLRASQSNTINQEARSICPVQPSIVSIMGCTKSKTESQQKRLVNVWISTGSQRSLNGNHPFTTSVTEKPRIICRKEKLNRLLILITTLYINVFLCYSWKDLPVHHCSSGLRNGYRVKDTHSFVRDCRERRFVPATVAYVSIVLVVAPLTLSVDLRWGHVM